MSEHDQRAGKPSGLRATAAYMRGAHDKALTYQREHIAAEAAQRGLTVDAEYVDDRMQGPAYERMLADIEGDQLDAVITTEPTRLTRDVAETAWLERLADEHNVTILYVDGR